MKAKLFITAIGLTMAATSFAQNSFNSADNPKSKKKTDKESLSMQKYNLHNYLCNENKESRSTARAHISKMM